MYAIRSYYDFTPEVRATLAARGIEWAEVTLYVGYGTFSLV